MASERVLHKGFDGAKNEFCPYDETSKSYDNTRGPVALNVYLGSMCAMSKPMSELLLLDIGNGTGTFLETIQRHVKGVTGLEYNDGMIAQARSRLKNVTLVQGSADKIPFEDGSFDVCTCNQVVHHFPKEDGFSFAKRAFQEAYRVLKPGGIFIIQTSTPEQQRDAFWWLSLFPKASDAQCERFPPIEVLKSHLEAAGFVMDGDSVVVPLHRTLMRQDKYLEHGVKGAFMPWYRDGDSSWSMAENFGELEEGLQTLQQKIDDGSADAWLKHREELRLKVGQSTTLTVYKS